MEFLKKIIHVLSNICYLLIAIYILIIAPKLFGYNPIVVLSGSMRPKYDVGTIIYYKQASKEEIKVGDVVTFMLNEKQVVTHRINRIIDTKYETKGDANKTADVNLIEFKNILGKVATVTIPYLGYLSTIIERNMYLVLVVILVLVLEFVITNFSIEKKKGVNYEKEK